MLTTSEVADRMGVSPRTVRRWIESGDLKGYQLGPRTLRVQERDMKAFAVKCGYSTNNSTGRT